MTLQESIKYVKNMRKHKKLNLQIFHFGVQKWWKRYLNTCVEITFIQQNLWQLFSSDITFQLKQYQSQVQDVPLSCQFCVPKSVM